MAYKSEVPGSTSEKANIDMNMTALLARLHLNNVFLLSIFDDWIYSLVKKIRTAILFWKPPTHIAGNYV